MSAPIVTPAPAAAFDVEAVRAQFPVLAQQIRGKHLVYLDSGASAQKPEVVVQAVADCYRGYYSNIHRGVHALSERSTTAFERAREQVARFVNAPSPREIVFLRSTTEAINLVASSFIEPQLGPDDEILVTEMEHHSNIVPWQLVADRRGAKIVAAPVTDSGELDLDGLAQRINGRTKLVAVTHVSNVLGTINPIADIVRLAHAQGVPVLVDGAQGVPHLAVDVQALGCDFYAFSAHKVYGPSGVGALWARAELLAAMPPYQGGGGMIRRVSFAGTTFADPPERFEAGTPDVAGVIGFGAAVEWTRALGLDAIAAHEHELTRYSMARLAEIAGLRLIGTAPDKAGVVSFVMDCVHPHDIGTILDGEGVAVRVGHHCAQPLMDRFGVPATARASFGVYNTLADVDALARALEKVRHWFG